MRKNDGNLSDDNDNIQRDVDLNSKQSDARFFEIERRRNEEEEVKNNNYCWWKMDRNTTTEKVEFTHGSSRSETIPMHNNNDQPQRKRALLLESDPPVFTAQEKLDEVMKINAHWQQDYNALLRNHHLMEETLGATKTELVASERDRSDLTRKVHNLQSWASRVQVQSDPRSNSDVEALKFQCAVYKEDFTTEREEAKKFSKENLKLKAELKKSYGVIDELAVQTRLCKNKIRKLSVERDELVTALRRSSTLSTPSSPPDIDALRRASSLSAPSVMSNHDLSIAECKPILQTQHSQSHTDKPVAFQTQRSISELETLTLQDSPTFECPPDIEWNMLTSTQAAFPTFQGGNAVKDIQRGAWERDDVINGIEGGATRTKAIDNRFS